MSSFDHLYGFCALPSPAWFPTSLSAVKHEVWQSQSDRYHIRCSVGHSEFWHKDCWRKAQISENGKLITGKDFKKWSDVKVGWWAERG